MAMLNAPGSNQQSDGLVPCGTCHKPMAKGARTCPHCGKTYTNASGILIAIIVGLIVGGWMLVK